MGLAAALLDFLLVLSLRTRLHLRFSLLPLSNKLFDTMIRFLYGCFDRFSENIYRRVRVQKLQPRKRESAQVPSRDQHPSRQARGGSRLKVHRAFPPTIQAYTARRTFLELCARDGRQDQRRAAIAAAVAASV